MGPQDATFEVGQILYWRDEEITVLAVGSAGIMGHVGTHTYPYSWSAVAEMSLEPPSGPPPTPTRVAHIRARTEPRRGRVGYYLPKPSDREPLTVCGAQATIWDWAWRSRRSAAAAAPYVSGADERAELTEVCADCKRAV